MQSPFFASHSQDYVLKLVLELRDNKDVRQLINNDTLIHQCNSKASQAAIKAMNMG